MYQIADVTGKVSDAVQARHADIPWREIAAFRNFFAHAYEGIDEDRMWHDVEQGEIDELAQQLNRLYTEMINPSPSPQS